MNEIRLKAPEEFDKMVKEVVSGLHRPPAGGLVSMAVDESVQPNTMITGRLLLSEEQETAREMLRYDALTLAEHWVPREQLDEYVSALALGRIEVGSAKINASFTDFGLDRDLGGYTNVSG